MGSPTEPNKAKESGDKKKRDAVEKLMEERDKLVEILRKAQSEIDKVKDIIPTKVYDPIKWLAKHRPDLLENKKFVEALNLAMHLSEKEMKKRLKRKTTVQYHLVLDKPMVTALATVVNYYVKDYCGGSLDPDKPSGELDFNGKLLKGIHNNYLQYHYLSEKPVHLRLSPQELAAISAGFLQLVEDYTEADDIESEIETVEAFRNFIKTGSIKKKSCTMIPIVTDDGLLDFKWEEKETTIALSKLKKVEEPKKV